MAGDEKSRGAVTAAKGSYAGLLRFLFVENIAVMNGRWILVIEAAVVNDVAPVQRFLHGVHSGW